MRLISSTVQCTGIPNVGPRGTMAINLEGWHVELPTFLNTIDQNEPLKLWLTNAL